MSEVIPLPKKKAKDPEPNPENMILSCPDCGCVSWAVNGLGILKCASCNEPVTNMAAEWVLPPIPRKAKRLPSPTIMTNLLDSDYGFRRHLSELEKRSKLAGLPCLVMTIDMEGGFRTWGATHHFEGEQLEWLKKTLDRALKTLNKSIDVR